MKKEIEVTIDKNNQVASEIATANVLINSSFRMGRNENNLLWLIAGAYMKDSGEANDLEIYRDSYGRYHFKGTANMPLAFVAKELGITRHSTKAELVTELKNVCSSLLGTVVTVETECGFKMFHFVSSCEFDMVSMSVKARLSDEMVPFFVALRANFTKIDRVICRKLKKQFSNRFYMLFTAYFNKWKYLNRDNASAKKSCQFFISYDRMKYLFDLNDGKEKKMKNKKMIYMLNADVVNRKLLLEKVIRPCLTELEKNKLFHIKIAKHYLPGTHNCDGWVYEIERYHKSSSENEAEVSDADSSTETGKDVFDYKSQVFCEKDYAAYVKSEAQDVVNHDACFECSIEDIAEPVEQFESAGCMDDEKKYWNCIGETDKEEYAVSVGTNNMKREACMKEEALYKSFVNKLHANTLAYVMSNYSDDHGAYARFVAKYCVSMSLRDKIRDYDAYFLCCLDADWMKKKYKDLLKFKAFSGEKNDF